MQPRPPQQLFIAGSEAYKASRYEKAVPPLEEFVARYPQHPRHLQAVRMLTASLVYEGRLDDALSALDAAARVGGDDAELLLARAHAFRLSDRYEDAAAIYESCLDSDPRIAVQALAALAEVRQRQRRPGEARALVERALAQGHQSARLDLARGLLALSDPGERPGAIQRLTARAADEHVEPEVRPALLHALGDLLDAEGRYDEAFARYEAANALERRRFDPERMRASVDRIIEAWPPGRVAALQAHGDSSERPLLVVGMPRSGTTLTERLLGRHPLVAMGGELRALKSAFEAATPDPGPGEVGDAARVYLAALAAVSPSADRVTDKMPMNMMHLGFFAALFPRARIVHCRRDPRDVCLSCYCRRFLHDHPWSTRWDWLADFYTQYDRVMDHWRETLGALDGPSMLEVRYEEAVADPEAWVRRLVEFAGLPWDESCRADAGAGAAPTLRIDQIGKGVYATSSRRHERYQRHLAPLAERLGGAIERYEAERASERPV